MDGSRATMSTEKKAPPASSSSSSSSTMKLDSYAVHSKNQYAAHLLTRDLLSASMERLAKRCHLEDAASIADGAPMRRRRMADLGSADGSSSVETLKFATRCLGEKSGGMVPPLHVTFEEHPASSRDKLETCLNSHSEWFAEHDIERDVLMESFYQPLFDPGTIDFMQSYICLHWLDTTDVSKGGSIVDWKTLGGSVDGDDAPHLDWVQINEPTAPAHVREAWRTSLAHVHLAKFLCLRSRELRPGAELLLVMVGHPHEFNVPSDGGPGPLTRAMKRCISRGELRRDVLHRTIIPYFMRTVSDIEAALEIAETLEVENSTAMGSKERPGALLQLVNCQSVPAVTKGDDDVLGGAFNLYWSIHSHSIEGADPTEEEMRNIKVETRRVFDEIYDNEAGIPSMFVACTLRRRTRERWET